MEFFLGSEKELALGVVDLALFRASVTLALLAVSSYGKLRGGSIQRKTQLCSLVLHNDNDNQPLAGLSLKRGREEAVPRKI